MRDHTKTIARRVVPPPRADRSVDIKEYLGFHFETIYGAGKLARTQCKRFVLSLAKVKGGTKVLGKRVLGVTKVFGQRCDQGVSCVGAVPRRWRHASASARAVATFRRAPKGITRPRRWWRLYGLL